MDVFSKTSPSQSIIPVAPVAQQVQTQSADRVTAIVLSNSVWQGDPSLLTEQHVQSQAPSPATPAYAPHAVGDGQGHPFPSQHHSPLVTSLSPLCEVDSFSDATRQKAETAGERHICSEEGEISEYKPAVQSIEFNDPTQRHEEHAAQHGTQTQQSAASKEESETNGGETVVHSMNLNSPIQHIGEHTGQYGAQMQQVTSKPQSSSDATDEDHPVKRRRLHWLKGPPSLALSVTTLERFGFPSDHTQGADSETKQPNASFAPLNTAVTQRRTDMSDSGFTNVLPRTNNARQLFPNETVIVGRPNSTGSSVVEQMSFMRSNRFRPENPDTDPTSVRPSTSGMCASHSTPLLSSKGSVVSLEQVDPAGDGSRAGASVEIKASTETAGHSVTATLPHEPPPSRHGSAAAPRNSPEQRQAALVPLATMLEPDRHTSEGIGFTTCFPRNAVSYSLPQHPHTNSGFQPTAPIAPSVPSQIAISQSPVSHSAASHNLPPPQNAASRSIAPQMSTPQSTTQVSRPSQSATSQSSRPAQAKPRSQKKARTNASGQAPAREQRQGPSVELKIQTPTLATMQVSRQECARPIPSAPPHTSSSVPTSPNAHQVTQSGLPYTGPIASVPHVSQFASPVNPLHTQMQYLLARFSTCKQRIDLAEAEWQQKTFELDHATQLHNHTPYPPGPTAEGLELLRKQ